jgi:hypothetical protein
VGVYHSHGADSFGTYREEEFSTRDKAFADRTETSIYVVTPKDKMLRYDPDKAKLGRGNVVDIKQP